MKVTDEARTILQEVIASNKGECLKAALQNSCCGTSFMLSVAKLADGDVPIIINEIPVLMEDDTKERSESVTIAVQNGKLVIQDEAASGCC